ncbi:hypothetical protein SARC_01082 [Sphaeroforma arctica JP610]|uniref:Response regulator receiver domain-containing protein n=1 Tax=Sphaeroforma arctica JP610 TaxID=667725 RepID=A0A0L0GD01_9EUKA|nr:hypothetical protein SARC_01082 [Sphaeroforma arctica JP610]KNC86789.1 hypothetical protein SARC_01082 [Sphaeroforma arctica JP610]|eukprot:XP_014160691.1 hypothetical protein SARC_01082 [Sphaeroforma arctica JP610]
MSLFNSLRRMRAPLLARSRIMPALLPCQKRTYCPLLPLETDEIAPPSDITPPFNLEKALRKTRTAEDAWNTRDAVKISMCYAPDCKWRNRSQFLHGRDEIQAFLKTKWEKELDYRLIKEMWCYTDDKIGVRFQYEWRDDKGQWYRSYGNEMWHFNADGMMSRREASINDVAITEIDRRFTWPIGARPDYHLGLANSPE